MSIRFADRLSFRLMATCMLCALAVGIALSAGQIVLDARDQSAEIDHSTEQVLSMLRQPAAEAAYNIDPVLARQVLDGLARYEAVSGATLVAYPSDPLATWQRERQERPGRAITDAIFGAERSRVLPLTVASMPEPVGELRVQVDTYPAGRAFLTRAAVVVATGLMRSLVLALVLLAIFYFVLTRPLSQMVERLSDVDPQAPQRMRLPMLPGHERDELGTWIGSANRLLQAIEDHIAGRKQAEAKAEYLQQFDRLTELPNRTLFYDRLDQAIGRARSERRPVAVLMCDIRDFQHINDQHGHDTGDAVLHEVAARIRRLVGEGVTLARVAGDRFAVLLENIDGPDAAANLAQRIVQEAKTPLAVGRQHDIEARLCVGIGLYPDDGEEPDALTRNAEEALNMAKQAGRSQVSFYVVELGARMRARRELVHDLERALERGELKLVYHPQFNTATNELVGAEALLRWVHPARGHVPPATFVPLAEESGLIVDIGRWVMAEACRQAQEWSRLGLPPLRVAVNVSAAQFAGTGVGRLVADQLSASGLAADRLDIEITETGVMSNLDTAIPALNEVRDSGARVSVDDFGTGQSSLSYLLKLPVTALKIDQSFVRQLNKDDSSTHIVNAIIGLGHSLKLSVIAEGVETAEQLLYLRSAGCDEIQGYFLSQPLDPARFPSFALMAARRPNRPSA